MTGKIWEILGDQYCKKAGSSVLGHSVSILFPGGRRVCRSFNINF